MARLPQPIHDHTGAALEGELPRQSRDCRRGGCGNCLDWTPGAHLLGSVGAPAGTYYQAFPEIAAFCTSAQQMMLVMI